MKESRILSERRQLTQSRWANSMLQHASILPFAEHAVLDNDHTGTPESNVGCNFSNVPAYSKQILCSASPRACPFGGTCHTCRARVQTNLAISRPGDESEQGAEDWASAFDASSHPDRAPSTQPAQTTPQDFLGIRLGFDFSQVRIHSDEQAANAAQAHDARAFTLGRDIYFGAGQYAPQSRSGQRLIAHELVHVMQQQNGTPAAPAMQFQLQSAPTKLVTSKVEYPTYPEDDEATLDKGIESHRHQGDIGKVSYKNLPPPDKEQGPDANIERRATKHALLEVILTDIKKRAGQEIRVRVPLERSSPIETDSAMVVLRFDQSRNVEVEYAGRYKGKQGEGSVNAKRSLESLQSKYSVKFVTNSITLAEKGKPAVTYPGKAWDPWDVGLLEQALPLLGDKELSLLKGCTLRRLAVDTAGDAAGFYNPGDNSINLANSALPIEKNIWFGEGGKFYSRGVFTVLHEIGHALHHVPVPAGSPKATKTGLDQFQSAVLAESKKRTKSAPGNKFPPPGIILPTDYSEKSWKEFYADIYAIFITNPSFLQTPEFQYLYDFFKQHFR
jgi:hypothetical protein